MEVLALGLRGVQAARQRGDLGAQLADGVFFAGAEGALAVVPCRGEVSEGAMGGFGVFLNWSRTSGRRRKIREGVVQG